MIDMALKHPVYDSDTHFTIDPASRAMNNEASQKTSLIQGDHNSERFTFELPRVIEGHDMSQCDKVEVHYINIEAADKKQQSRDVYEVDDMQVSPDNDEAVVCSWLISQNATKYIGSLNFLLRFSCHNDDGTLAYAWNSAVYRGISVSDGIYNGEAVVEEFSDILQQWRNELGVGAGSVDPETIAPQFVGYLLSDGFVTYCNEPIAQANSEDGSLKNLLNNCYGIDDAVVLYVPADSGTLVLDDITTGESVEMSVEPSYIYAFKYGTDEYCLVSARASAEGLRQLLIEGVEYFNFRPTTN